MAYSYKSSRNNNNGNSRMTSGQTGNTTRSSDYSYRTARHFGANAIEEGSRRVSSRMPNLEDVHAVSNYLQNYYDTLNRATDYASSAPQGGRSVTDYQPIQNELSSYTNQRNDMLDTIRRVYGNNSDAEQMLNDLSSYQTELGGIMSNQMSYYAGQTPRVSEYEGKTLEEMNEIIANLENAREDARRNGRDTSAADRLLRNANQYVLDNGRMLSFSTSAGGAERLAEDIEAQRDASRRGLLSGAVDTVRGSDGIVDTGRNLVDFVRNAYDTERRQTSEIENLQNRAVAGAERERREQERRELNARATGEDVRTPGALTSESTGNQVLVHYGYEPSYASVDRDVSAENARARMAEIEQILPTLHPTYDGAYDGYEDADRRYDLDAKTYEDLTNEYERLHAIAWEYDQQHIIDTVPEILRDAIISGENLGDVRRELENLGYERNQINDVINYGKRLRDLQEMENAEKTWASYIAGEVPENRLTSSIPALQRAFDALESSPLGQADRKFQSAYQSVLNPIIATIVPRTLTSLTSGVGFTNALIQTTFHPMRPINWNNAMQRWASTDEMISETVMNSYDITDRNGTDWFDKGYSFATSTIDSVTAGLLAMGTGQIASGLGASASVAETLSHLTNSAIFFGSAAQSYARDAIANGASDSQALMGAIYAGTAEALFEDLSFGAFYDGSVGIGAIDQALKHTLIDMGINASEEFNTEVANILTDWLVMGGMSDFSKLYQEYLNAGYTEEEAKSLTIRAMAGRAIEAGISGALQGGVMNAVSTAQARATTSRLGRSISAEGRALLSQQTDRDYSRASDFDVGAAFAEVYNQTRSDLVNDNTIKIYLRNLKVSDENVDRMTEIIRKTLMGLTPTKAEFAFLNSDKASQDAWRSVIEHEADTLGGQLYSQADANRRLVALAASTGDISAIVQANREAYGARPISDFDTDSDEGLREALSRMDISPAARSLMQNLRTIETANGNNISEADFAAQFSAAYNTGRAFYDRQDYQKEKIMSDYGKWAGRAFDLGAAEVADISRQGSARTRVKGTVTDITQEELNRYFKNGGAIAPVSVGNIAMANLTDAERKAARRKILERTVATRVAQAVGAKIVLYESTSQKTPNGWYDRDTGTIYLDVNAGDEGNRSMLRAMAHEMTHMIQTRSPKEYSALRQFIVDKYFEGNRELLEQRAEEALKNDPHLKPEYAIDEVIADSCEMMLRDTDAIRQIYEQNRDLFQRIKDFIAKVVRAIKEAFEGVDTYSDAANDMREYWSEIQKLWDAGLVAASIQQETAQEDAEVDQKVANGENITPRQEARFSRRHDTEYMDNAQKWLADAKKRHQNDGSVVYGNVSQKTLDHARKIRSVIQGYMTRNEDAMALPPDVEGDTFLANQSYVGSQELTTECVRSLAAKELMDKVAEELKRPLTVEDTIAISEELMAITDRPECVYCYVAADRRAFRDFLGKYLLQRKGVYQSIDSGMSDEEALLKFIGKRKPTDEMKWRFSLWTHTPARLRITAEDLANNTKMLSEYARLKQRVVAGVDDSTSEGGEALSNQYAAFIGRLEQGKYTDDEIRFWQLYDATKYARDASWAKEIIGYTAYDNGILNWTMRRINLLNSEYGMRMYSFSDYSPAFILENMQMITDAAVRGLKVLAYTKEMDFAEIFAPSGANIEISVFATINEKGEIVMDEMMGANWKRAMALRDKYQNVGITLVATNDALVEWGLRNPNVDVVIPYHLVRTGQTVAEAFNYINYTSQSHDVKLKAESKKDENGKTWYDRNHIPTSVSPVVHNNDIVEYVQALRLFHLRPRFEKYIVGWEEFLNKELSEEEFRRMNSNPDGTPYYMKLVNETRQTPDDIDAVQPIFNVSAALKSLYDLKRRGGYGVAETLGHKYEGVITDVSSSIADAIKFTSSVQTQIKNLLAKDNDLNEHKAADEKHLTRLQTGKVTAKSLARSMISHAQHGVMATSKSKIIDGFRHDSDIKSVNQALEDDNGRLVMMSPMDFIALAADSTGSYHESIEAGVSGVDLQEAQSIARMMREGTRFHIPYLNLRELTSGGINYAVAAYMNGYKKIPVAILADSNLSAYDVEEEDYNGFTVDENVQYSARRSKPTSIDMVEAMDNLDNIPDAEIRGGIEEIQHLYEKYKELGRERNSISKQLKEDGADKEALTERRAEINEQRRNIKNSIDDIMERKKVRDFLEAERTELVSLFDESAVAGRDYVNRYYNSPMREAIEAEQARTDAANQRTEQVRQAGWDRLDRREQEWRDRFERMQKRYDKAKLRNIAEKRAMRESFNERLRQMQEDRTAAALRDTARARIRKLADMLTLNNDQQHIITELRKPVASFLSAIDSIPRGNSRAAIERAARWYDGIQDIFEIARRPETAPVTSLIIEQNYEVFKNLADAVQSLYYLLGGEDLPNYVRQMAAQNAGRRDTAGIVARGLIGADEVDAPIIDLMNSEQLTNLNRAIRAVQALVNSANRVFANERYANRQRMVDASHAELRRITGDPSIITVGNGNVEQASLKTQQFLAWNNGTPYYVFKRFGSVGKDLYMTLARGWGDMSQDVHRIGEDVRNRISRQQAREWRRTVVDLRLPTAGGEYRTAHVTMAQLMSLYCHFRQEQSIQHIGGGGFTFSASDVTRTDNNIYHLSVEQAEEMFKTALTAQAKAAAVFLQEYMAEHGADMGNEVSRALYGYEYFDRNDKTYFPIHSSDVQHQSKLSDPTQSLYALLHMTETRARNPRANTTLVVSDIFDVFAKHMADMAKYKNLALPVLDIANWLNGRTSDNEYIKQDLRNAFGSTDKDTQGSIAQTYVTKFLQDINATYSGGGLVDKAADKLMRNMKRAAVGASVRVALQQPFSYTRAMYTMNPKYLIRALRPTVRNKQNIEEALRYSGLARAKADGAFTSDVSPTMSEQIVDTGNWRDTLSERALTLAEKMDEVTWGRIWQAAKYQVEDTPGHARIGSEEYFQQVRAVFDEVILSTQVMDGTLTRSAFMRDKTMYAKIMTAFMAEPTLTYNMILDGIEGLRLAKRTGGNIRQARGNLARAIATWSATQIANALITALVDSFRDDDDYERFFDKFADHFGSNLLDNMNPLEGIPIIKTLWELIVATWKGSKSPLGTEFQGITQTVKTLRAIYDTLNEEKTEANHYGKTTTWGLVYSALQAVSYLSGLPIANATRIATGSYNVVTQIWNDVFAPLNGHYMEHITTYRSSSNGYDELFKAEVNNNEDRQRNLIAELAVHGIESESLGTEMRNRTRDAFIDGSIGAQKARDILLDYGYDAESVEQDLNYWMFKRDYPGIEKPTSSMANAYYDTFQNMGISAPEFAQYWRYIHGDGITQDEVRAYLNSLTVPGNVRAALWHTKYSSKW